MNLFKKTAILGGLPIRTKQPPIWPVYNECEANILQDVLKSGNWGGYPSPSRYA